MGTLATSRFSSNKPSVMWLNSLVHTRNFGGGSDAPSSTMSFKACGDIGGTQGDALQTPKEHEQKLNLGAPTRQLRSAFCLCLELEQTQEILHIIFLNISTIVALLIGWCHGMPGSLLSYERLLSMIDHLDPTALDCRVTIARIRHSMDASCDGRAITIRQWRALLERVSVLQSEWTVRYKGDLSTPVRHSMKGVGSK